MKTIKVSLVLYIILLISCKDEHKCPPSIDLGDLYWSEETKNWIPEEYFNLPHTIKYLSENNEEKSFHLEYSREKHVSSRTTTVACEEGDGTTEYKYDTKLYGGKFISNDSLVIFFGLGVRNEIYTPEDRTEADFYEYVNMSMAVFYNNFIQEDYSWVRVLTDIRNAEFEDIDHTGDRKLFHETIEINGEIYNNVYSDPNQSDPPANIYFKKGEGIIAFIDGEGITWKLVN